MGISKTRAVYLFAATILGIILSFIAHAVIENNFLQWASDHNVIVVWYGGCALTPAVQAGLILAGAIGGFLLGRLWWRKVYIDKTWRR